MMYLLIFIIFILSLFEKKKKKVYLVLETIITTIDIMYIDIII